MAEQSDPRAGAAPPEPSQVSGRTAGLLSRLWSPGDDIDLDRLNEAVARVHSELLEAGWALDDAILQLVLYEGITAFSAVAARLRQQAAQGRAGIMPLSSEATESRFIVLARSIMDRYQVLGMEPRTYELRTGDSSAATQLRNPGPGLVGERSRLPKFGHNGLLMMWRRFPDPRRVDGQRLTEAMTRVYFALASSNNHLDRVIFDRFTTAGVHASRRGMGSLRRAFPDLGRSDVVSRIEALAQAVTHTYQRLAQDLPTSGVSIPPTVAAPASASSPALSSQQLRTMTRHDVVGLPPDVRLNERSYATAVHGAMHEWPDDRELIKRFFLGYAESRRTAEREGAPPGYWPSERKIGDELGLNETYVSQTLRTVKETLPSYYLAASALARNVPGPTESTASAPIIGAARRPLAERSRADQPRSPRPRK